MLPNPLAVRFLPVRDAVTEASQPRSSIATKSRSPGPT